MKAKHFIILLAVAVFSLSVVAFAGNYRLPVDGTGKYPVTQYAPKNNLLRKSTTAIKGSFANISTYGAAALKCSTRTTASATAAGTATVAKVRFGGYSTGNESGSYPTAEDTYWNPPATIGFMNYSGIIHADCSEQR